jgi:O-antigen/teichoic acid export membrane protein
MSVSKTQPFKSKRQILFKNSIYGVISWVFPIVPTLIVTPIVISRLGNELYGVYVIILGFSGYFFTLNVGKAVTKFVAEYHATGETDKISKIVSATLILGFAVGSITTLTFAVFARNFVDDVMRIPEELQSIAVVSLYLACANILVSMLGLTFQYILQGLQRFDWYMLITNSTSILLTIGILIAVLNGYGVISLLAILLSVSTLMCIVSAVLVKRLLPELRFQFHIGKEAWSEVWRYGLSIMAYQLFGSLLLLFERTWITRQFGPEALTFYVVPMTLALYMQMFVASLVLAIFPVVNQHLSDKVFLADLHKKATKLILIIVAFALLSAFMGGRIFLGLWLNEDFANASYDILLTQFVIFSIVALTMIPWQIAESFRFAPMTAVASFSWMAISIPLMILFSYQWQSLGVAYGRLIGVLAYVPLIIFVERTLLGGIFWTYWSSVVVRVLGALVFAGIVEYLLLVQLRPRWTTLVISILCGGIIFVAFLFLFRLFGPDERSMIKNLLLFNR